MLNYTHAYPSPRRSGEWTLFNVESCENCDTKVRSLNSLKILDDGLPVVEQLGLTVVDGLPPEQFHSDDLGHACCENCDDIMENV